MNQCKDVVDKNYSYKLTLKFVWGQTCFFQFMQGKEEWQGQRKRGKAQHKAIMTTNHCSFQVIFLEDKHKIKDCLNCNRLGNFFPPYISSYVVEGQVTIPKSGLAPVNCKHSASNERGSSWQPWPQICCDLSLVCHLLQWPYCLPGALQWSAWILLEHLWWQSFFFPKDWKKIKKKRKENTDFIVKTGWGQLGVLRKKCFFSHPVMKGNHEFSYFFLSLLAKIISTVSCSLCFCQNLVWRNAKESGTDDLKGWWDEICMATCHISNLWPQCSCHSQKGAGCPSTPLCPQ